MAVEERKEEDLFIKDKSERRTKKFFVTSSAKVGSDQGITSTTISSSIFTEMSASFSDGSHLMDVEKREILNPVLYMLQEMQADLDDVYNEVSASAFQASFFPFATISSGSFGVISSSLIPHIDDKHDLGSDGKQWKNLYLDGTANLDRADIGAIGTNLIPVIPAKKGQGQTIGTTKARWSAIYLASTIDVSGSSLTISSPSASVAGDDFNVVVSGSIVAGDTDNGSVGTIDAPFKDLYVQSASIYLSDMSDHGGKKWSQMSKSEKLARTTTFRKEDIDKLKRGESLNDSGHLSASGDLHIVGSTTLKGETDIEGETTLKGNTTIEGITDIRGQFRVNGAQVTNLRESLDVSNTLRNKSVVSSSVQLASDITGSFTSLSASIATDINNAGGGTIDSSLSNSSTNAVRNSAVHAGLATKLNLSGGTMTGLIQPIVTAVKSAPNKNTIDARATNVFQVNSKQAITIDMATALYAGQEITIVNLGQGAVTITHQGKPIQTSFFIYGGKNLTIATGQVYKFVYTAVNQWLVIQ